MADYQLAIFAADNLINPQNPGFLPAEDTTFMSDLVNGDQLTWVGGGESLVISITDNTDADFDEARSDQTLTDAVMFGGASYSAGQVVTPTYTIQFSGSDGQSYTLSSFNFSPNTNNEVPDAVFWEGDIPPPGTVLTVTGELNPTGANSRDYADMAVCFTAGVRILTPQGERPVESLKTGDLVTTLNGQPSRIKWIGCRHVCPAELRQRPNLRPIRIAQGALGQDLPTRDLVVSPQHKLMIWSKIAERMFGAQSVLVAAKALVGLPGITVETGHRPIRYYHIALETHEVLYANGAPAESLHFGPEALKALSQEDLRELRMIFPALARPDYEASSAQPVLKMRHQRKLVERHSRNRKPLIAASLSS